MVGAKIARTLEKQKRLRRSGKNTQMNSTEKVLMTQITTMGVITHLEPDILECKVKRAFGSITMNKASGGDGIPAELFQILKDDASKVMFKILQARLQQYLNQELPGEIPS